MAWSRVQSAVTAATASAVSSVAATYGSNLTSGTTLIACVGTDTQTGSSTTISTVKDGAGNSFTLVGRISGGGSPILQDTSLWVLNTPSGDVGTKPTITATLGSGTANMSILIQEVSGLSGSADGTLGSKDGSATGATGSPTYSSTASNEYLVSVYGDSGGPLTWTKPAALTADANSLNSSGWANIALAYGNSTGGTEAGSWSLTGTGTEWGLLLVAFALPASFSAASAVAGTGSLNPAGAKHATGASAISGTTAAAPSGTKPPPVTAAAAIAATGAVAPAGIRHATGSATITGAGTLGTAGTRGASGSAAIAATGAMSVSTIALETIYYGSFTRGYLQYTDLSTGHTLVAVPGHGYAIAVASGWVGLLSVPPSDGYWSEVPPQPADDDEMMGAPLATEAPAHFTARDKIRWRQRKLTQATHVRMASRARTRS